jgi:hypothetical protein
MQLPGRHCVLGAALGAALTLGLSGCGGGGSEPSEADMKDALLYAMNHPPGVKVSDPVTITFFKKEACDKPTEQGFRCTYDLQVASRNQLAGMWANVPFGFFYRDKDRGGKWNMRPPF